MCNIKSVYDAAYGLIIKLDAEICLHEDAPIYMTNWFMLQGY